MAKPHSNGCECSACGQWALGEVARLRAGWASVDTTKLADITDLDECKRRLQRERERSHGLTRDLCDMANTPAGAYKARLDAANAEVEQLRKVAEAAKHYIDTMSGMTPVWEDEGSAWDALRAALEELNENGE